MPIYEYVCSACEHEFEQLQKYSVPPAAVCPHCTKAGTVTRKLSTSAFILNGGGWYSDGYGKSGGNGKSEPKSESTGGGETKSGEIKSGETKSASACAGGACGCAA